jgi:hypothetical protein
LTKLEFWAVVGFALVLIGFGVLVEVRTAFLSRRMGDLDCYLRAAWAVRTGNDLYSVVSDNGWHYNYPPLLAILMTPLADPPWGQDRSGFVPFPVSAAVWYVFNLLLTLWSVHHLANALQATSTNAALRQMRVGGRLWWAMRLWPLLVCLIPAGHSLMRGQANTLVLALFSIMAAAYLRQQRFRAGLALAFATCFKVFPIFLIVYPLWKRDWRCVGGAAAGLVLGLFVLPLPFLGLDGTTKAYQQLALTTLGPAFHLGDDTSRESELLGAGGTTDNQALKFAVHNLMYVAEPGKPPGQMAPWIEWGYRIGGALMTLGTLLARRGRATPFVMGDALQLTALMGLMLMLCPMCHLHYFLFLIPVVQVMMAWAWAKQPTLWLGWRWHLLFTAFVVAVLIPNLPGVDEIRNLGFPTWVVLAMWAASLVLSRREPTVAVTSSTTVEIPRAA